MKEFLKNKSQLVAMAIVLFLAALFTYTEITKEDVDNAVEIVDEVFETGDGSADHETSGLPPQDEAVDPEPVNLEEGEE